MNKDLLVDKKYFRELLDAFPSPVLIVNQDLEVFDFNKAFKKLQGKNSDTQIRKLCGNLMNCIHALESEGGCGTTEYCPDCVLRQTAEVVLDGENSFRKLSKMQLLEKKDIRRIWLLVSGSFFHYENKRLVILTLEDITEVIELRNIIPICSYCRKVRDDNEYWQSVEEYFLKYTDLKFSHSICPDCLKEHHPKFNYNKD